MKRLLRFAALGTGLLCAHAHADYGWIPEYKKLNVKTGVDFYSSDQNYNATGAVEALSSNGSLKEYRMWLEGEYGLAEDWAGRLRLGFTTNQLSAATATAGGGGSLATGSGLSDFTAGIKWNVKTDYPIVTLDVFGVFPLSPNTVSQNTQLVVSDGVINLGFMLHTGTKAGPFLFSLSPGVIARFNGYSSLALGELAIQLNFPKGFVRGYGRYTYSFEKVQPFDINPTQHTAPGSGGSYLRLNGSPQGLAAGGILGITPIDPLRIDLWGERAVSGQTFAVYNAFGVNVTYTFDFFKPKKKSRVREVPFEGESDSGYPN